MGIEMDEPAPLSQLSGIGGQGAGTRLQVLLQLRQPLVEKQQVTLQRIEPRVRERVELLARDLAAERPDAALDLAESLLQCIDSRIHLVPLRGLLQEQVLLKQAAGKLADFDRGRCLGLGRLIGRGR